MKKINWKVRVKNPCFWLQIIVTIFVTILGYAHISASEITTWAKLFELIKMALSNPYCLFIIAAAVVNAIVDPTTKGLTDSQQALTYETPKEE